MDTTALSRAPFVAPTLDLRPVQAVRTDLPPPKAVSQLDAGAALTDPGMRRRADLGKLFSGQGDADTRPSGEQDLTRGFVPDETSRDLVYRVADPDTGAVVYQLPSEQALKLRAYAEQAGRSRESPAPDTDLEA